jgi:NAD(P)-dependent dehydrogenase (short-subunit alcohol dehydrogenase family)
MSDDPITDVGRPLAGKVAIVTGAASGIGAAVVRRLLSDGAKVVAADLNAAAAPPAPDTLDAVVCDVRDELSVRRLVDTTVGLHGRIDVLVNAAGVVVHEEGIEQSSLETWRRIIETNLTGPFLLIKHAVPHLRREGGGAIVNVASTAALKPSQLGTAAYVASKGGLVALTRQLVIELAPLGVTVNAVAPGPTASPMTDAFGPDWPAHKIRVVPAGRLGQPDEIAACVAFFARPDARYVTGQLLVADGGMTSVTMNPAVDAPTTR